MRSSNIGLFLAQNEESRIAADQAAQALADAIVANPASTPVVGETGFTFCTAGGYNCDRTDLPVQDPLLAEAIAQNMMSAKVERTGTTFRPPPRVIESRNGPVRLFGRRPGLSNQASTNLPARRSQ